MTLLKKSLILAAISLAPVTNAKINFPDKLNSIFVTLNPSAISTINGPIVDAKSHDYKTYADNVIKIAMQETHNKAKRYLKTNEYKKYYSMMLAGLTIPMHEGIFTHFRRVKNTKGRCDSSKNDGDSLKNQGITRTNFRKAFHNEENASKSYLSNCKNLKANQPVIQMIAGGGDGSDVGIMQLSVRWHYKDFLAPKKFKSVRETLRYGNGYYLRGFNKLARDAKDYPCITDKNKKLDHVKLARAAWGGWYNAGGTNYVRACRISFKKGAEDFKLTDPEDKFLAGKYTNPETKEVYKLGDRVTRVINKKRVILKQCLDPNFSNRPFKTVRETTDGCDHINKDKGFNSNLTNMVKVAAGGQFGITLGRDKKTKELTGFWPHISSTSRNAIKDIVANLNSGKNNRRNLDKVLK
jgi:hypothetical protein